MAAPIKLLVLGSTDLGGGDGPEARLVLAHPKRLALLSYLAVHRPYAYHRRDELYALLWPDADEISAKGNLRHTLWRLRKALGPQEVIVADDLTLMFDPAVDYWLDAQRVAQKLAPGASVEELIATVSGDFQTALGCSANGQTDCLAGWLEDPDGDGVYTFTTTKIPAGSHTAQVVVHTNPIEMYGAGGAKDGASIPFTVAQAGEAVTFSYDAQTHVLSIK